jgi:VanZ family protein
MFRLLIEQKKRAVTVTFIFCVLLAILDEIHQIFVPGRSAEVRDVLIDTLGACFGLGIVWGANMIIKKVKKL